MTLVRGKFTTGCRLLPVGATRSVEVSLFIHPLTFNVRFQACNVCFIWRLSIYSQSVSSAFYHLRPLPTCLRRWVLRTYKPTLGTSRRPSLHPPRHGLRCRLALPRGCQAWPRCCPGWPPLLPNVASAWPEPAPELSEPAATLPRPPSASPESRLSCRGTLALAGARNGRHGTGSCERQPPVPLSGGCSSLICHWTRPRRR